MNSIKVSNIFNKEIHNTDKDDLGYIDNFYDDFLLKFYNKPINFMEIGVQSGGSIKLWKDYFHNESSIYGGDINYFYPIDGVNCIYGNMYEYEQVTKFSDEYFDLIIDDGPHSFESFVLLIQRYFSKIKLSGSLIVEDVIYTSWVEPLVKLSEYVGYSKCEVIDMTRKQKTNELYERWANGLYILNITK